MVPTFPVESARPTLTNLIARIRHLLTREGYYQSTDAPLRLQPEWELFFLHADPHDPAGWRVKRRYRRDDLVGVTVYDLSDLQAASWRRPPDGLAQYSARDVDIWSLGRDVLEAHLRVFLPPALRAAGAWVVPPTAGR